MPASSRRRWLRWLLLASLAILVVLAIALRLVLQPERATRLILTRLGNALDLEIFARGTPELQLRGTPTLVIREVTATQRGARTPLLRVQRILLSLPWSTIRNRGRDLDIVRIELDAPVLDMAAAQRWLASQPRSETPLPTLRDGLRIARGRIDGAGWRIEDLEIRLPQLHRQRPLRANVRGRYVETPTTIPFDFALAMTRPANDAGAAVVGTLAIERGDWRLPARIKLSGPLHIGDGGLQVTPARLAMSAAHVSGDTHLRFVLGAYGALRFDEATWTLAPVTIALRGQQPLPAFDARGALAFGRRLVVRFAGRLPQWPESWPTLPPPLGAASSPLPFALDYAGAADMSEIARLQLQHDEARFDARFRLPDVLAWNAAGSEGTPLPPLSGTLSAPQLEIAGTQLEGVEVVIDEPSIPAAADAP